MSGLGPDIALVLRRTARIVIGRWRLFLLLGGLLVCANMVQAAVLAVRFAEMPTLATVMIASFMLGRLAVLVTLHIAGVRLAADPALPAGRVLALDGRQALWFHGLILIWIMGLTFRFGVGAPVMRRMTDAGVAPLVADISVTSGYLLLLFVLFSRIQPGVVGVMLGAPDVDLRWSIRHIRGRLARLFIIATVIGWPPLMLRQALVHALAGWPLGVALADGYLSALMMLLPSVAYHRIYERIRADERPA